MRRILAILALGLLLAGCTQSNQGAYTPPSNAPVPPAGGPLQPPSMGGNQTAPSMNGTPAMNQTNASGAMNATPNMTALAGGAFDSPGNVLISDQFNNRIIEVNPANDQIVWSFGSGNPNLCNPGPGSIIGSNWAERLSGGLTIIAGTGIPSSATNPGCPDNRVIVVNQAGQIVWQYGQANVTGSDADQLNVPVSAVQLPNGDYLITDQGNNRVIEVNQAKAIVWWYGPANGSGALNSPNSAELLANGHVLIADENNNRTIEVDKNGSIVWQYADPSLGAVAFASRLPDGDTLVTDSGNARIIEVTPEGKTVWQYYTNSTNDSNSAPLPTNAVMFGDGRIMVADQYNHRVFALDYQKNMLWQYGQTNVSGNGTGQLNGPYTAFVIGDYTGQTAPPGMRMGLASGAFADGWAIPSNYTCEANPTNSVSPPLSVSNVPAGTKSLAFTVYDIDAPFVHWDAWNVDPAASSIAAGSSSSAGVQGTNGLTAFASPPAPISSWPTSGFIGPCPPPGSAHRYIFTVYALDSMLSLQSGNYTALQGAMQGHVLGSAKLTGTYKCSKDTAAADGLCR